MELQKQNNARHQSHQKQKQQQQQSSTKQQQQPSPTKPQQQPPPPQMFMCQERLEGRESPELFKEALPGAWEMHREYITTKPREEKERRNARFRTELDPDDVKLVNELGHLSADKLMDYVRSLQATSLSLGEEEATQFTRAKLMKILEK